MIEVGEALALILSSCRRLPEEPVPLAQAVGRVLARDVVSTLDLPPFDNSAMDGFALRCAGAELAAGSEHTVHGEQAAGDGLRAADGACEIMTGAPLPAGLDAVLPVEQALILDRDEKGRARRIRLLAPVRPCQHVRAAGEDIARGDRAVAAGTLIAPQHVLLLAGLGIATLPVARRPRVALLCTGRELIDDPALALLPGQIRNANGPYLVARLREAGADIVHVETVCDDPDAFHAALARAQAAGVDLVLSTGAVSMGRYDFVPAVLAELGAGLLFHKVAMRPGKPLLCARLPQGALYFGLPGNPVSSAVGQRFFVEPALRALLGLPREQAWRLPLAVPVRKKPGFALFQKAVVRIDPHGRASVALSTGQESFKTRSMAAATVWAALPAAAESLRAGECIEVHPLGHELSGLFQGEAA